MHLEQIKKQKTSTIIGLLRFSFRKRNLHSHGFTLIELLVVMAVMSVLVGIGVNTFSIAQKKARDTKRKADLRTIQTALEIYYVNTGQFHCHLVLVPVRQIVLLQAYRTDGLLG